MVSPDLEEFIAELNAHGVRYLIVGAHALALHARPRATKDLDLFLDRSRENVQRLLAAIRNFLGASLDYREDDFTSGAYIIQLGVAPNRIDLIPVLEGVADFDSAWNSRTEGMLALPTI